MRDIKLSCIKTLDNLKEELDIKNIVNDNEIFVEFDSAYKKLGQFQKDKFLGIPGRLLFCTESIVCFRKRSLS